MGFLGNVPLQMGIDVALLTGGNAGSIEGVALTLDEGSDDMLMGPITGDFIQTAETAPQVRIQRRTDLASENTQKT